MLLRFDTLRALGYITRVSRNPHGLEIRPIADRASNLNSPENATVLHGLQSHFELSENTMDRIRGMITHDAIVEAVGLALLERNELDDDPRPIIWRDIENDDIAVED